MICDDEPACERCLRALCPDCGLCADCGNCYCLEDEEKLLMKNTQQLLGRKTPGWVYHPATNKPRFEVRIRPTGPWWNRNYVPQIWDNDLNDWHSGVYVGPACGYEVVQSIANSLNGVGDEQGS